MLGGGILALLAGRISSHLASGLAALGVVAGGIVGLFPVVRLLATGEAPEPLAMEWNLPLGRMLIALDPISAVFALPVLVIFPLAAIYGIAYWQKDGEKRSLGPAWFFFGLLAATTLAVVVARNGFLFLLAWEGMSIASYFLVTFYDERDEVVQASWIYLVASHIGAAFLLALFLILGQLNGSMDFPSNSERITDAWASVLLVLALIGFGCKAGLVPFHVWLPEAYPAAPTHVTAVMTAVMSKLGIYGLLRVMMMVGHSHDWWAWTLIALGCGSGIYGIVFASAQQNLKKLLAYSSIENIGIITLGLGIGVLGLNLENHLIEAIGFGGALLHVWNHSLFKCLLFFGAGSLERATGTTQLDSLGGLLKLMPWTGCCFLLGSAAICGLPPLNGFASEFLLYYGAFQEEIRGGGTAGGDPGHTVPALIIIGSLALMGGLAALTFTKACGIGLLGAPRTEEAAEANESSGLMIVPMLLLAAGCVVVGLMSPAVDQFLAQAVSEIAHHSVKELAKPLAQATEPLGMVSVMSLVLLGFVGLLTGLRWWLLSSQEVGEGLTWDCGYAEPEATMQYSSTSFSQPATDMFLGLLRTETVLTPPTELFPANSKFETRTPDVAQATLFTPFFTTAAAMLSWWRWVQHGRLNLYILSIAVTLTVLLVVVVSGQYVVLVDNWKQWLRSWQLGG